MGQYHASKLAAHKETMDLAKEDHHHFDIVTLHPVFVFGHSLIQKPADDLSGSPGMLSSHSCRIDHSQANSWACISMMSLKRI